MKKFNVAVVGLGNRGASVTKGVLLNMDRVNIVAVCDEYADRVEKIQALVNEKRGNTPLGFTDYKEMFDKVSLDAVYVATSWETHTEISVYALKKGVPTAMEVGGAYTVKELWDLVKAYEETNTPFMFMENCCFNDKEMTVAAMAKDGVFGKIVHAEGAYAHDLREEIASGKQKRHYRLRNYLNRNCENYPTHELGPIAKMLNINEGNRFVSLVSVASCSAGMEEYIKEREEQYPELKGKRFNQGDIVTTVITCAGGETILLRLDTTLPRYYSRKLAVRGTKGFYDMDANGVFLDGMREVPDCFASPHKSTANILGNLEQYHDKYLPDIWKNLTDEQRKAGHGGMDYFEFVAFFDALEKGESMPINVYDAAAWMAVTVLSEQSVARNGEPQVFPDFTTSRWTKPTV